MKKPVRIVITGAESSGKSTITRQLGERFNLPIALEYARFYLEEHGPDYDLKLLETLAGFHLDYQKAQVPEEVALGIFDTDLINYKIWTEEVFGSCPQSILDRIENETNHRYLICAPDLPWEFDPLRENPNDRLRLCERHIDEIQKLNRPYEIITGLDDERLQRAIEAFNSLV